MPDPQVAIVDPLTHHRSMSEVVHPWAPGRVMLFSGHIVDTPVGPNRAVRPVWRPTRGRRSRASWTHSARVLSDSAICGGGCSGDLLFAEGCLSHGAALELYLPFDVPTCLERSVDFAGAMWRRRFEAVRARRTASAAGRA